MADADHYIEAADGLQTAAKALRACGEEEAGEDQPTNLRDARKQAKTVFAKSRQERDQKSSAKDGE